jgi:RNA-binding motif X-linked protein 2
VLVGVHAKTVSKSYGPYLRATASATPEIISRPESALIPPKAVVSSSALSIFTKLSFVTDATSSADLFTPNTQPAMNSVRAIQQLNKRELESATSTEGSWHTDYRDTAFINIGGLPFELSEGDLITICSQYGEPVWVKMARDKETGKSRGFAWIKYEDQRSCDLAVDNLGGSTVMGRVLRVDHARYKPKDDEDMRDNTMGELDLDPGTESDGGRHKRQTTESGSESDEDRPLLPEEIELERLMEKLDEDDPMRDSMIKCQQDKVDDALKKLQKANRKEKERAKRREKHHRKDGSRDRHRDKDRRRIKEGNDGHSERHSRRREDRVKSREEDFEDDGGRRKSSHKDDPHKDERQRHRDSSREMRSGHKDGRERARRDPDASDEGRERSRSKRSPLPYRARSPHR